jgi:Alw26I/Eco31I/Esp3I family type II restriction m6 adenine DNA methyltransferase
MSMGSDTTKLFRQSTLGLFEDSDSIDHVELAEEFSQQKEGKNLAQKNSGKFYTPEAIALPMIRQVIAASRLSEKSGPVRIIDPFCGDGRLAKWLIPHLQDLKVNFEIHLWDYDDEAVAYAAKQVDEVAKKHNINFILHAKKIDSFGEFFKGWEDSFDIVITNPPWEVVKPDPKDLLHVDTEKKARYIASLKEFSNRLLRDFPLSKPTKAFGGWGVNLARVGSELSVRLSKKGGVVAIVAPSTIFADQNSCELRKWIFDNNDIKDVNVYPAELKLFTGVDQPSVSFVLIRETKQNQLRISNYERLAAPTSHEINDVQALLDSTGYVFPVSIATSPRHLDILASFSRLSPLSDLEAHKNVWIGRELDETNYQSWLSPQGKYRFVKGRDIDRFNIVTSIGAYVNEEKLKSTVPVSAEYHRIVWRDVSRPTQKRRVIATMVPPGYVTGNSLGVLHIKELGDDASLATLLGLISSFVFEFQLRAYLATAHVSAGVMRKVRIPAWNSDFIQNTSRLVKERMGGVLLAENQLEVDIAKAYGLSRNQFSEMLSAFPKVSEMERETLLSSDLWNRS